MGHNMQKIEGKAKKNAGKMTNDKTMEMKGKAKESSADIKDKFD